MAVLEAGIDRAWNEVSKLEITSLAALAASMLELRALTEGTDEESNAMK